MRDEGCGLSVGVASYGLWVLSYGLWVLSYGLSVVGYGLSVVGICCGLSVVGSEL